MKRPVDYVESTIPSFYYELRTDPDVIASKNWTRDWWASADEKYQLVTSSAVVEEISRGIAERAAERKQLIQSLPLLTMDDEVVEIVQSYLVHRLMPRDTSGDALHLAVASFHKCDFLLTWNCQHLANANKFGHIRRINTLLGLFTPTIVTPMELLGVSDE